MSLTELILSTLVIVQSVAWLVSDYRRFPYGD